MIAQDISRDLPADSPMVEDADLLRSEIERCRQILNRLSQRPDGNERDASDLPMPLSAVIENAAAPTIGAASI